MVKELLSLQTLEEKEAQGNGHRHAQPKAEALVSSSGIGQRQDDPAGASAGLEEVGISADDVNVSTVEAASLAAWHLEMLAGVDRMHNTEVGHGQKPLEAGSKLHQQPGVEREREASSSLPQAELGYVTPWDLESKSMNAQGGAAARAGAAAPVSGEQVEKDNASRRGADDSMVDGLAARSGLQGEDAAAKTERERLEVETEQLRLQVPCFRIGVWILVVSCRFYLSPAVTSLHP